MEIVMTAAVFYGGLFSTPEQKRNLRSFNGEQENDKS